MAGTGWYVLYRDGLRHSVRATDGCDAAIGAAWQLYRDGRDVIQVGPRDRQRADEVISAHEIRQICARMERANHPPNEMVSPPAPRPRAQPEELV
jgi:hypothetical protein